MSPTHSIYTLPSGLSFRMVNVPGTGAGHFIMGSPENEEARYDDETQHPVRLSDFQIGEFPVTQELWKAVMGENPAHLVGDKRPIETVSWYAAAVFCNALNALLGKPANYFLDEKSAVSKLIKKQYAVFGWDESKKDWAVPQTAEVRCDFNPGSFRLPTEAEWEYAARGGPFAPSLQHPAEPDFEFAGSDDLEQVGWFHDSSQGETHDVGRLLPNALWLYDMSGNVYEWCNDFFGLYPKKAELGPKGPKNGSGRILRGGYATDSARACRVASRYEASPEQPSNFIGFRLVFQ